MPKLKKGMIVPTPEEDAQIQAGIDADPDTYELSKSEVAQMKRVGRPRSADPKILLSVRYDREVVEAFKSQGPGWQSRMNEALREWLREHTPA